MITTSNPASLEAATDINEVASVLRETIETLATTSALLTDLIALHGALPALGAAAEAILDVVKSATAVIDAGRTALLDTSDALAFGEGEVAQ